jgi:hypothetical protein
MNCKTIHTVVLIVFFHNGKALGVVYRCFAHSGTSLDTGSWTADTPLQYDLTSQTHITVQGQSKSQSFSLMFLRQNVWMRPFMWFRSVCVQLGKVQSRTTVTLWLQHCQREMNVFDGYRPKVGPDVSVLLNKEGWLNVCGLSLNISLRSMANRSHSWIHWATGEGTEAADWTVDQLCCVTRNLNAQFKIEI